MSFSSSRLCLALAFSATAQLLLMTALVVLPQWRAQQSANDGFVTFFVGNGGSLRLWNRPVDAAVIPGVLRRAEQLNLPSAFGWSSLLVSPGVRFRTSFFSLRPHVLMFNFSFLRQHAPDLLPIAVPIGLAVMVHGV